MAVKTSLNYTRISDDSRSARAKYRVQDFSFRNQQKRHLLLALFEDGSRNPKDGTALRIVPDAFVEKFIDEMRAGSQPGAAFARVFQFFNTEIRDNSELSVAAMYASDDSPEIIVATQGRCAVFVRDVSGEARALPVDTVQNSDELQRLEFQHSGKFMVERRAGIIFNSGSTAGTRLTRCIGGASFRWMGKEPRLHQFRVDPKSWVLLTDSEILRASTDPRITKAISNVVTFRSDRLLNLLRRYGDSRAAGLLWRNR